MTLQEVIDGVVQEWWGVSPGPQCVGGVLGLASNLESAVRSWMTERDCLLDQIIALVKADLNPCLRLGSKGVQLMDPPRTLRSGWNLQLSPEAGHVIDFSGATLEDVLQEACAKYLPKEATTCERSGLSSV